jgi:hypothetical protein
MRRCLFVLAVLQFSLLIAVVTPALAQQKSSRRDFCNQQHYVCELCQGLGANVPRERCLQTCKSRLAKCLKTGCHDWIAGGPRCEPKS